MNVDLFLTFYYKIKAPAMKFKNIILILLFLSIISCFETQAQLNGTYTIKPSGTNYSGNPSGTSGYNYTSLNNAVSALKSYGVSGQVTFNIDSGSYKEQVSIPAITGVSASKRIVFQSTKNDSSSVVIFWSSTHKDTNYTIMLEDADYFTFKNLTISATGKTYGYALVFNNGASNNIISNSIVKSETGSTDQFACIYSPNSYDPNNLIENNIISGGFYGIYLNSGGSESGNVIKKNTIKEFFYHGISALYQDGLVISNNFIENSKSSGLVNSIYTQYCNYIEISSNRINCIPGSMGYGINLINAGASPTNRAKIINNFISLTGKTTNPSYAINLNYSSNQDIAYNSICMTIPSTFSFCVYMSGTNSSGVYLTNNVLAHYGGGFAIFTGNTQPLSYSNYNDLYSTGTYLCYYTANVTTLAAWRTASGKDMNSINVEPGFVSYTDLHVNNAYLNAAGIAISGISTDIDGNTRSSTPDIGADEFTPIANDAGVNALASPLPACVGSNSLSVKVKNYGTATLNSVTINWQLNGVTQTPISFTSLSLAQNKEQTFSVSTINFTSTSSSKFKFWTSSPNGNTDGNNANDTLLLSNLTIGLKDTFTIGKTGGNYNSINQALNDLILKGVCGPVVFRIQAGTYNEQIEIPEIIGASATNTVTFESFDKDSSKAILEFSSTGASDNYVINLNRAKYIKIKHLGLKSKGTQYGMAVVFSNGAEYNTISNNNISVASGSTSSNLVCIFNSNSTIENNNIIENNVISGGSSGVLFSGGSSSVLEKENIIRNNQIIDFSVYGIQLLYEKAIELSGNYIRNFISAANVYGIFGNTITDTSKMLSNNINVSASTNNYGIYLTGCYGFNAYASISNNFILQTGSSSSLNYGIYMNNCQWYALYYNTVKINSSSTSNGRALVVNIGTQFIFKNNILSNFGGGYSIHLTPPTSWVLSSDYNDLYTTGSTLGFYNKTNYSNLSTWKSGTSQDAHSVSADPYFVSANDLHVSSKVLDSAGIAISNIKYDIDKNTRNLNKPDIGADEFTLLNYDLAVSNLVSPISPCSGSSSNVSVKIMNYGVITVKNTKIKWSVNGAIQSPKVLLCNLAGAKDTIVSIGSFIFNSGTSYTIKVWVDSINGKLDENAFNDTLIASNIITGMNGNYTIGSGKDYKTFTSAVKDLKIKGVCGPVVFTADTGIYNEQISLPQISGASSINTITFRSASSDSTKTIIQYSATSTADNYVIQLDGADYVRFEKFYLKGNSAGLYAQVVNIKGGANYNIFSNNKMETNTSLSAGNANVFNDQNSIDNYNVFQYNHFKYGAYLISCSGSSNTALETGNAFYNNICDSFGYYGIFCQNQDSLQITGNILRALTAPYGISIYNVYNLSRITNNQIHTVAVSYPSAGIQLNYLTGSPSKIALVANNIISVTGSSSFPVYGIYATYCYYNKFYHNSINVSATTSSTSCGAIHLGPTNKGNYGQIDLKNNIIVHTGGGYAIYVDASAAASAYLQSSNYNNLFSNGSYLGFYNNSNIASLANWIATSGKDQNSISLMPPFIDFVDLHLKNYSGLRLGNPLSEIKTDVDFENRSPSKPVIGADENPCLPLEAGIISIISPKTTVCEGLSDFTIRLCNFGTTKIDSVDIQWIVNGDTNKTVRYKGSITHLQEFNVYLGTDSLKSGQINNFFAKILSINGQNDQYPKNDAIENTHYNIFASPVVSATFHDTICKNTNATLKVTGNTDKYLWYTTPSGGAPLSEDSVYQISTVTATKPYYVEAVTAGAPDSLLTQKLVTFNQNMGNMFNIRALNADVIIDSFAIHPNAAKGARIPLALYYKSGTYQGFEKDSSKWTFGGYDTAISNGQLEFTTVSLGNIKIKKGDSISFYLSTTYDAYLLYSSEGAKAYSNSYLRISTGNMTYFKFDSLFQSKKSWNGIVYYSTSALCRSARDTVYAVVLATPNVNLGADTAFCRGKWLALDAGAGPGFKYAWKYGSNTDTISTLQKLKLDSNGIYSVTVSDTCGFSSADQIQLSLNPSPEADFDINDSNACFKDNKFIFNNKTNISSGTIKSYQWQFGDGQKSALTNPTHTYGNADSFIVSLIAVSDKDCPDTQIFSPLIVYPSPETEFSIDQDTQCLNENLFTLSNLSKISHGNLTYIWQFGDGGKSTLKDVAYSYSNSGSYKISLIGSSNEGCKDTASQVVLVKPSPIVFLGNDTTLKTNQSIVLRAGKGFDSYLWSGGEKTDTLLVKSTYKTIKTIWVKVDLNACMGGDTITLTFDTLIGINERELVGFNSYPNPVTSHVYIQLNTKISENAFFELKNIQGKTLIRQAIKHPYFSIELTDLPSGLFLITILIDDKVYTGKILKE